jgi:uncharacterized membrane protein (UPF0127 family)
MLISRPERLRFGSAPLAAAMLFVLLTAAAGQPANFARTTVRIQAAAGSQVFDTQIATTPEEQELGLMYVRIFPVDQAMIFPMEPPRIAQFWMKNTFIPLDLLFIDEHGRIACIRPGVPQSLDLISCPTVARAVLEIGGGQAAARHIKVGDRVVHEMFGS